MLGYNTSPKFLTLGGFSAEPAPPVLRGSPSICISVWLSFYMFSFMYFIEKMLSGLPISSGSYQYWNFQRKLQGLAIMNVSV